MFTSVNQEFQIPSNWVYRGEGNCNVVISLPKEKKILRIRKINKTTSLLTWFLNWLSDILYWYCGNDELRDLMFYKKIIRPLIGKHFVCDAEQVFLSRKQIKILEEKLDQYRPDYRKFKSLQYGRVAIFDDYAFLPNNFYPVLLSSDTFAIEIKPKQGWVPFSEKKYPKCIFCMNQYIKRNNGQTKSLTAYCPLDLFSGDSTKMIKALKSLIDNPQNNFKIFKNGQLCYSDDSSRDSFRTLVQDFFNSDSTQLFEDLQNEFCALLKTSLLTNFEHKSDYNNCNLKLFCEWNKAIQENSLQNNLPEGCVLEKILSVQMLDVEGSQYYYKLLNNRNFKDYNYVRMLLKEISKHDGPCFKCLIMMLGDVTKGHGDLVLVPYLISAIAKDCSLMLTFRKILQSPGYDDTDHVISTKYGDFIVNVGVFDLYPKPLSTIIKHKKRIKKMLDLCLDENK